MIRKAIGFAHNPNNMPTANEPLSPEELTLSAHPHGDGIGTLFRWQGSLYRAIHPEHTPLYRRMFEQGIIDRLCERGMLVRSTLAPIEIDGCDLVFRHDEVPFVTYPTEWCGPMLRAAAIATLDLQLALMDDGLTLIDAHHWNILFDATRPVMVDLTAIHEVSADGRWSVEDDFRGLMLYPAMLASRGRSNLGRLLTDTAAIGDLDLVPLLPQALAWRFSKLYQRISGRLGSASRTRSALSRRLNRMRRSLEQMSFDTAMPTSAAPRENAEQSLLQDAAQRVGARTALTVECGKTPWPTALANVGLKVVACDRDKQVVGGLFNAACAADLDILPVYIDLAASNSTFGTFERTKGPVTQRLHADLVVATFPRPAQSVVQAAGLSQHVQSLMGFCERALLVRITRHESAKSGGDLSDLELEAMLHRHCPRVTPLTAEGPGDWYLCER